MKTKRRLSGQLRGAFYAGYSADTITIPKQLIAVKISLWGALMPQPFIS
jgi:hypothetical protein